MVMVINREKSIIVFSPIDDHYHFSHVTLKWGTFACPLDTQILMHQRRVGELFVLSAPPAKTSTHLHILSLHLVLRPMLRTNSDVCDAYRKHTFKFNYSVM